MIPPNAVLRFDLAGTLVALGNDIANTNLKVGDSVAGMVMGGSVPDKGAFAGMSPPSISFANPLLIYLFRIEYAKAESDLIWTVPDSITLREAAGVSATLGTAAQSLFHILGLPYPIHPSNPSRPSQGSMWILIYGGSSSVGLFAIQLAKFAGFKVITVCSPRNFELVKQHGADAIVDYSDAKASVQMITNTTRSKLTLALDCISAGDSATITLESLVGEGERRVVTVGQPSDSEQQLATERGIKMDRVMAWTLFGLVS
jgi:NADPH:quinone reductase-like Zn-dependent oxidoreductase